MLLAFRQRYERLLELSAHALSSCSASGSLTEHDYDLAVLARSTASAATPTSASWPVSPARTRSSVAPTSRASCASRGPGGRRRQGVDAVSEEEGADAVRLLTIHAAKGLEFKVVVVADAGRNRPPVSDILRCRTGASGSRSPIPRRGRA